MGGKGSGGARMGAGRKRKTLQEQRLTGTVSRSPEQAGASATAAPPVAAETPAIVETETQDGPVVSIPLPGGGVVTRPNRLNEAEVDIWNELAPLAVKAGTLVPETSFAFCDLVELVVLRQRMKDELSALDERDGKRGYYDLTISTEQGLKAHPLITQYRSMMQRVEAGLARFRLAPFGKEILPSGASAPKDDFGEFDDQPPDNATTVN